MSTIPSHTIELMVFLVENELKTYAQHRANDVKRGAESPELAGLLVQKYGLGAVKTLEHVFHALDLPMPTISVSLDCLVESIDPEWRDHQKARWSARPAGVFLESIAEKDSHL